MRARARDAGCRRAAGTFPVKLIYRASLRSRMESATRPAPARSIARARCARARVSPPSARTRHAIPRPDRPSALPERVPLAVAVVIAGEPRHSRHRLDRVAVAARVATSGPSLPNDGIEIMISRGD